MLARAAVTASVFVGIVAFLVAATPQPAHHDEAKVPAYTLPDPLVLTNGASVKDISTWHAQRRPELLRLFAEHEYGRTPNLPAAKLTGTVTSIDRGALAGKAVRKEVTLRWAAAASPELRLLIYYPSTRREQRTGWPVLLGLNFFGNHTVHSDPGISLAQPHVFYEVERYRPAPPGTPVTSEQRGVHAEKWQIETAIARGYAVATMWCNDLSPDRPDGLAENLAGFLTPQNGVESRDEHAWGAIGVWAFGLSRILDYLETESELDARRVAVHGFSRLGKAAVWAAAQDERFAMLISNESGCGGAALHKRIYGETVALINTRFPHWFAKAFRTYNDNEAALPIDQHQLLALIAPRPLYVGSAKGDQWSDPRGEFLGLKGAEPVYRLLGRKGLGADAMPAVDAPVIGDAVGYHIRSGKHDMTAYDWEQYFAFADRFLK